MSMSQTDDLVNALMLVAKTEAAAQGYAISDSEMQEIARPLIAKGVAQLQSTKVSQAEALAIGTNGVKKAVHWILHDRPKNKPLDEQTAAHLIHRNLKSLSPAERTSLKGFYPTPQYEI